MIERDKQDADEELMRLLTEGHEAATEICLMRLGGPRRFRTSVISILDNPAAADSQFTCLLRSTRIPTIRILLASMDDSPFLSRMDKEVARSWKIWRVRSQVRQFAIALMEIAKLRHDPNSLMVGFHKEDLIWNIGIVGSDRVLLRPYGSGTGHDDSTRSVEFLHSQEPDLVLSFIKYFDSISYKPSTCWLSAKDIPSESPLWPSLYKGNAILSSNLDHDGTEESRLANDEVCKICFNPESTEAETRWLSLGHSLRQELRHFRPGEIRGPLENLRGKGLRIQRIQGHTLFDVMSELSASQRRGAEHNDAVSRVATVLLRDSYDALIEFRTMADRVFPPRKSYPYATKLRAALSEVRPYFPRIDSTTWEASLVDTLELGRELEAESHVPFRDAHLKNRIWQTSATEKKLVADLLTMSTDEIVAMIKMSVRDIDFETAIDAVTEWDDLFHLLCFEYSNIASDGVKDKGFPAMIMNEAKKNLLFWRTGLMRALREHCRRLWYQNVMPSTFKSRYSQETPGYFLGLAQLCSENASGFLGLQRLLEHLPLEISNKQTNLDTNKAIRLAIPLNLLCDASLAVSKHEEVATKKLRLFVSYSHEDQRHIERLQKVLSLLKREGVLELWTDRHIEPGQKWEAEIRSELENADIIVFLVSPDLIYSTFITDVEFPTAIDRYKRGEAIIIPIIVRPISYKNSAFAEFQALPIGAQPVEKWPNSDDAWVNIEEELRTMLRTVHEHGVQAWLTRG
ncbi:MAG: toll/interleukin-1 receptor domain-containing protein [bacterium]